MILLVVWSANGDCRALTSKASSKVNLLNDKNGDCKALTSEASSKVNLLNDETYRRVGATVIVSSFGHRVRYANLLDKESISG